MLLVREMLVAATYHIELVFTSRCIVWDLVNPETLAIEGNRIW